MSTNIIDFNLAKEKRTEEIADPEIPTIDPTDMAAFMKVLTFIGCVTNGEYRIEVNDESVTVVCNSDMLEVIDDEDDDLSDPKHVILVNRAVNTKIEWKDLVSEFKDTPCDVLIKQDDSAAFRMSSDVFTSILVMLQLDLN